MERNGERMIIIALCQKKAGDTDESGGAMRRNGNAANDGR